MNRGLPILALAALALGAGCSRQKNNLADTTLNSDLSLAQQQRGYHPVDSLSPAERGLAPTPSSAFATPSESPRAATTTRRTSTSGGDVVTRRRARTRSSSGTTASTSSGGAAATTTT